MTTAYTLLSLFLTTEEYNYENITCSYTTVPPLKDEGLHSLLDLVILVEHLSVGGTGTGTGASDLSFVFVQKLKLVLLEVGKIMALTFN